MPTLNLKMNRIKNFFEMESAAGIVLAVFAIFAIIIANTPFSPAFQNWLNSEHILQISNWHHQATIKDWIKDGLMAIFFFHVGLEIKKEIMVGSLSDAKTLALPIFGAIGGMLIPALIFCAIIFGFGQTNLLKGWPIPVATDIAFAIAAVAIIAHKIPSSLKVFLLTLAVVDDLGAVVLIATLFGHEIEYQALSIALCIFIGLLTLSFLNLRRPWLFVVGGIGIWAFMLQSGLHPTLAGILTAIAVPLSSNKEGFESPLEDLHDDFSAWVKYAILPLFALSHAGFSLDGMNVTTIAQPLFLAVFCGLLIGKPIGVVIAVYIANFLKIAKIPEGVSIQQIFGIGALCGIGFTMSLFLGELAFANSSEILKMQIKSAVFGASLLSAILGVYILSLNTNKSHN
jgi:Na+:H+ antiporter, NhaA family